MIVGRPSRDEMFMQLAHVVATRSTCQRAHVGAIITNMDGTSIKSMGYNGNARGLPDGCDTTTPGACGCLHAEENALLKSPYGPPLTMYTTMTPCLACAKRILNSSVRRIVYDEQYRDDAGLRMLTEPRLCLEVEHIDGRAWWQREVSRAKAEATHLKAERGLISAALLCFIRMLAFKDFPDPQKNQRFSYELDERAMQAVQDNKLTVSLSNENQRRLIVEVR